MQIAILNPWFIDEKSIGGTERFVKDLSKGLASLGHHVDVYMLSGRSYTFENINFISLNFFGNNIIADEYLLKNKFGQLNNEQIYDDIAKNIDNMIDFSHYDFVQINSHLFLKCCRNKKRIYVIHSNLNEFLVSNSKEDFEVMIDVMKKEIKFDIKFVVVSNAYLKFWKNKLKSNVYSIPHAINIKRLFCEKSKKVYLLEYNLSSNKIKILLPSRLEPIQKKPMTVLKACKKLPLTNRNKYQIIFTGLDSQYTKYIEKLQIYAKKNNIDAKFISFNNIAQAYNIADYVILPSKTESFGYSALESLSLGIPTFLSNIPSFREIASGNENAIIFNNINHLTKLLSVSQDKYKRKIVSKEWKNRYDINKWIKKYLLLV